MSFLHRLWTWLPRPLDPMRSIKIKLGVLAVCNACLTGLLMVWGYGRLAADLRRDDPDPGPRHDLAVARDDGRAQVFERFSRGSASPIGGSGGGTGLGLAIARWVVDLHGGRIAVADSPAGCLIRVVLPQPPEGLS